MQNHGNILICAHKFLTQPDDDLVLFLNSKKIRNLLHIRHSFSDAPDRCSRATWYKNGAAYKEYATRDYRWLPEPLIYAKEMLFTFKWALMPPLKWDMYVGMDGLCILFGNTLRFFGKVRRTIYWAIDFVPANRFKSRLLNAIYHLVNTWGYKRSSEMWDLSPRMAQARHDFLKVGLGDIKKLRVVPYGVWTGRIKRYSYAECQKETLVFMGHLIEKQGVQLVIRAIPEILKTVPGFRFKIIGGGAYRQTLEAIARDAGVSDRCDFMGKIDDIRDLESEVSKSCAAIAPYVKELDNWTYYADPGKVKTYLACGVPVLLTDIPWNAAEIAAYPCGRIVSGDVASIAMGVAELMRPETNQRFRDNAAEYSLRFDWGSIFKDIFARQAGREIQNAGI